MLRVILLTIVAALAGALPAREILLAPGGGSQCGACKGQCQETNPSNPGPCKGEGEDKYDDCSGGGGKHL